jgi:hypothetical protein
MVGFRSKRIMSVERYADPVTMDHIIELRKKLAIAERQRDNALSVVYDLRMDNWKMREAERQRDNALDRCVYLDKVLWKLREEILMLANGKSSDDERNC